MTPIAISRLAIVGTLCLLLSAALVSTTQLPAQAAPVCRADVDLIKTSLGSIRAYHYATCQRRDIRVTVTGRLSQGTRTNVTKPTTHVCRAYWSGPRDGSAWLCIHSDMTALTNRSGSQQYCGKTRITWSGNAGSGNDVVRGCASY